MGILHIDYNKVKKIIIGKVFIEHTVNTLNR